MENVPNTRHRFDIGPNEEIRKRVNLIQEAVREMQKEHPEIVSFAMFGSTVKGYATEGSDIDGNILVALDYPNMLSPSPTADIFWRPLEDDPIKAKREPFCQIGARFDEKSKEIYTKYAKQKIGERVPDINPDQLKHIQALPISTDILDNILSIWVQSEQNLAEIASAQDEIMKRYGANITISIFKQEITKMGIKFPKEFIVASEYLAQLFFLDIGSRGLKPFRSYVIEQLSSFGDLGHQMWKKIIGFTEIMERGKHGLKEEGFNKGTLTDIHYPRTLDQAKKVYG